MLKAKDIMTADVVTVPPEATVREAAELLVERSISAVPVVEDGKLVGIVSEGDLVRRAEIGTGSPGRSWWLTMLTGDATLASEYTKSHALRVRDVMTKDVATVEEDASLAEIADLLEKRQIKRVPVTRGDALAGVVSRANLVRAIATAKTTPLAAPQQDDTAIRARLIQALRAEAWNTMPASDVTVSGGVAHFWGTFRSSEEREASRILAEGVAGVKKVEDHRVSVPVYHGAYT